MWQDPDPSDIENWVCIFQCGTDYEAEMAKNYLANLQIPANILSKRDSAYSLNIGDMALVYVYVPRNYAEKAQKAIDEWENAAEGEVVYLDADMETVEEADRLLDRNSIPSDITETEVDNEEGEGQVLFALSVSSDDEDEARQLIAAWEAERKS